MTQKEIQAELQDAKDDLIKAMYRYPQFVSQGWDVIQSKQLGIIEKLIENVRAWETLITE